MRQCPLCRTPSGYITLLNVRDPRRRDILDGDHDDNIPSHVHSRRRNSSTSCRVPCFEGEACSCDASGARSASPRRRPLIFVVVVVPFLQAATVAVSAVMT